MSQMFADIDRSKELKIEFERLNSNDAQISGITFSAEVLTSGNWPADSKLTCAIPAVMKDCTEKFTFFYKYKH